MVREVNWICLLSIAIDFLDLQARLLLISWLERLIGFAYYQLLLISLIAGQVAIDKFVREVNWICLLSIAIDFLGWIVTLLTYRIN